MYVKIHVLQVNRIQVLIHTGNSPKYCFKSNLYEKLRPLLILLITLGSWSIYKAIVKVRRIEDAEALTES